MSPKSNKSGVSYDEHDPRGNIVRPEPPREDNVPRVTRARDLEAAEAGLRALPEADPGDFVGEDAEEIESPEADSYDDKEAWPYAALQEESRRRWADQPVNVSRDDLVARLREDDAKTVDE